MMLLKKIHHLVNNNINETIKFIKDIKEIKNKIKFLEEEIKEKDCQILELEKNSIKNTKDVSILAGDIIVLSNFAKELWVLWEDLDLDEFDLFDLKAKKEKKKNNYH
jgi:hypothetical protein